MRLAALAWTFLLLSSTVASAFCFEEAGRRYGIHPDTLRAIAFVESAYDASAVNRNADGSLDMGLMQINSQHRRTLPASVWRRIKDPCVNVLVGAWVLADCIRIYGRTWEAAGCYNAGTGSSPLQSLRRTRYAWKVYRAARLMAGRNLSYGGY